VAFNEGRRQSVAKGAGGAGMLGGIGRGMNKCQGRGGREGVGSEGAWHDSTNNWLYLDASALSFLPLFFQ